MSALDIHSPAQSLARYPAYKDSGIDWIGEIPSHWEVRRLKFNASIINGYAFKSEDIGDEGEILIRIGDIENSSADSYKRVDISKYSIAGIEKFIVKRDDILVALTGATIGKTNTYNLESIAYLNQRVGLIRANIKCSNALLSNIFKSQIIQIPIFLECFGSAQENISINDIGNIFIPLPPLHEQEAIARFLDDKCAKIDELVAIKEQQIDKLKELRQAKIHQAVTKGLNPNVPLKDSGIEWIGQIPEHWEVKRLKYFSSLKARIGFHGLNSNDLDFSGFAFCITGTDFKNGKIDFTNAYCVSKFWYDLDKNIQVKINDVLVTKDGSIGKIAVINTLPKPATLNSGVFLLRSKINSYFLYWSLCSKIFNVQVDLISRGSTINHLYERDFKNFIFLVPPLSEQEAIAAYLDNVTKQIDQTINHYQNQIEKLKEYKQSLINAAVTGKIKVA